MLEVLNTFAALGTFVVITVTALAAVVQLRHLRSNTQLQVMIDLNQRIWDPRFQALAEYVLNVLPRKLNDDPRYLQQLAGMGLGGGDMEFEHNPQLLAIYYDELGLCLRSGMLEEKTLMQFAGGARNILRVWKALAPVVHAVRTRAPGTYSNFEYAAARAEEWLEKYPNGSYPKHNRRMLPQTAQTGDPARP